MNKVPIGPAFLEPGVLWVKEDQCESPGFNLEYHKMNE